MDEVSKAVELFRSGFMCSQAVFAAFSEKYGVSEEQALRIGACFGSGMNKGDVCGACTGALMALGLAYGNSDPADMERRLAAKQKSSEFLDEFKRRNGSFICNDLLGCDLNTDDGRKAARENGLFVKLCPKYVKSAAEIVVEMLERDPPILS